MADFTIVTKHLATGAAISGPEDVAALKAAGITAVIDCREEFDDGVLLASSGMAYIWDPTVDDGKPKPNSWWAAGLSFGILHVSNPGEIVYAHCAAGVNRGPSMCYGILRVLGHTAAEAEAVIRAARPQVGLAYKADFERYLKEVGG